MAVHFSPVENASRIIVTGRRCGWRLSGRMGAAPLWWSGLDDTVRAWAWRNRAPFGAAIWVGVVLGVGFVDDDVLCGSFRCRPMVKT